MTTAAPALDPLDATFGALAHPARRAILARLSASDASVTELAAPFDMTMPAVTKHLKVLEHAGLISRGRHAQWRPCRLEAEPLRRVADWVATYRRFWEESLDRLDEYLRETQRGRAAPRDARSTREATTHKKEKRHDRPRK